MFAICIAGLLYWFALDCASAHTVAYIFLDLVLNLCVAKGSNIGLNLLLDPFQVASKASSFINHHPIFWDYKQNIFWALTKYNSLAQLCTQWPYTLSYPDGGSSSCFSVTCRWTQSHSQGWADFDEPARRWFYWSLHYLLPAHTSSGMPVGQKMPHTPLQEHMHRVTDIWCNSHGIGSTILYMF